jgi:hypothetical protein
MATGRQAVCGLVCASVWVWRLVLFTACVWCVCISCAELLADTQLLDPNAAVRAFNGDSGDIDIIPALVAPGMYPAQLCAADALTPYTGCE